LDAGSQARGDHNEPIRILQQAEKWERQAAIADLKSSGRSFLSAAAQWRGLAAHAVQREAIKQDPTYGTGARTD
jgi:hypothetical protein